ncbi:MAG: glycosyltransferase [Sodaliphilus sp.]
MKLSVIVPCYNVEGYLPRCVDSLLHQDLAENEYEILLIDDGSTDATAAICDRYAAEHTHVSAIHQTNSGQGAARNTGLDLAKGSYIFFVDSDDFVPENRFGALVRIAEKHQLDVLGFHSADVVEHNEAPILPAFEGEVTKVLTGAQYLSENTMQGPVWWFFTRRELIEREQLRFAQNRKLEDSPFTPDVILSAERMAQVDDVCYFYVNRATSTMHSNDKAHCLAMLNDYIFSYKSVNQVIEKHRSKMDASALSRLCARRDSFLYFGIFRALKAGTLKEFYFELNAEEMMPLKPLDKRDFPSVKWTLLRLLFNCPALTRFLGMIYTLIYR